MAYKQRNYNSVFDTWSSQKKITFWLTILFLIASIVTLNVPVGVAFLIGIFFVSMIWKSPHAEDLKRGSIMYGSRAYNVAEYMNVLKEEQRSTIFTPTVMFGFGPPEDDYQKEIYKSFLTPPSRLEAYWALTFGISVSFIDYFIHPYLYPAWGQDYKLPVVVSVILSAIGFFGFFQVVSAAWRYYVAKNLSGATVVPAVMLNKLPKDGSVKKTIITSVIIGLVVTAVIMAGAGFVWTITKTVPWLWVSVAATAIGISIGLRKLNSSINSIYREEFLYQIERRDFWNGVWAYKKDLTPFFDSEAPVPGEPGKPGGPPAGSDIIPDPHVWAATFSYPTSGEFGDYAGEVGKISASLANMEMIAISPIPRRDPTTGKTLFGTVSNIGFRVWFTDQYVSINELIAAPDITPELKEIAVRALVTDKIADSPKLRGRIGRCLVHSHAQITDPESRVNIMKISVVPPDGVTESAFTSNIEEIQTTLSLPWVRAKKSTDRSGKSIIDMYIGDGTPNSQGLKLPAGGASSKVMRTLQSVDWEYNWTQNGIRGNSGSPALMLSRPVTETTNELVFDLPAGVDFKEITKREQPIMSSSGNEYIELSQGVPNKKSFTRREQREFERFVRSHNSNAQFTAVVATQHPLKDIFYLENYKEQLLTGRELGVAKIDWSPGVMSNGLLASHSFAKDMAHLVVAGSSGSGKSVLIYSMLIQLLANNHPSDLQIWIIDPKIGFQDFQMIDGITRYVDSWTPDDNFYVNCRDLLLDAVNEMKRRNKIFRYAYDEMEPAQLAKLTADDKEPIDKLGVARRVGQKVGPMSDGSPNPLVQPYLIVIIDECALLYTPDKDKETKELQAEILFYASRLARESRSAGIHMLNSTQYPTSVSLPVLIKQQSARIGLMTQDMIASKVIIDEPGLEDLFIKGSGKIADGKSYRDFRGYLLSDGKAGINTMSEILDSLPKREPNPADGRIYEIAKARGEIPTADMMTKADKYLSLPGVADDVWRKFESGQGARLDKIIEKQKSDARMAPLEMLSEMSDEEFNSMSLDQFKERLEKMYS